MEKDEKVRFILEQMRLCLAKKDYIRTQIISKKINIKFFAAESDLVQVGKGSIQWSGKLGSLLPQVLIRNQ